MALETRIGRARGRKRHTRVVVEEQSENRGHGAAHRRVPGDVLGKVRRGDEGCPTWIGVRRAIVILVGTLDRGDRTPEIEGILRVPTRDPRVSAGNVHERKSTSRVRARPDEAPGSK